MTGRKELAISDFEDVDNNEWYNLHTPEEKVILKVQAWEFGCPVGQWVKAQWLLRCYECMHNRGRV